jgi:hypothetical protein
MPSLLAILQAVLDVIKRLWIAEGYETGVRKPALIAMSRTRLYSLDKTIGAIGNCSSSDELGLCSHFAINLVWPPSRRR